VDGEPPGPLGLHFGRGVLSLGAGISLPTGEPEEFAPSTDPIPNSSLQTGTGTYDPLVTAVYSQSIDAGSAFASFAARIPGGENRFDYLTGLGLQASLGAVIPAGESWDVLAKVTYVHTEPDELDGRDAFATGGDVVALAPGVRVGLAENVDLEVTIDVPVFYDLETQALVPWARLAAGLTVTF